MQTEPALTSSCTMTDLTFMAILNRRRATRRRPAHHRAGAAQGTEDSHCDRFNAKTGCREHNGTGRAGGSGPWRCCGDFRRRIRGVQQGAHPTGFGPPFKLIYRKSRHNMHLQIGRAWSRGWTMWTGCASVVALRRGGGNHWRTERLRHNGASVSAARRRLRYTPPSGTTWWLS
jgi:hypothetical protein